MSPRTHAPGRRCTASELGSVSLFEGLPEAALRRLATTTTRVTIEAGGVLFREGEAGRDVFVVTSGRLEVVSAARPHRLAWIGPQGIVGERALLDGGRRCATVSAVRDSELLRIAGDVLERLLDRHPPVLRRLSATVASRVQVTAPADPGVLSIAVVATGSTERWRATRLCTQLAEVLGRSGPVVVVDRQAGVATGGTTFDALESQHRFVILEAGGWRSEWTRRCLRHADRVLLVGDARADPATRSDEVRTLRASLRAGVPCELVLLHDDEVPAAGTSRWLAGRPVSRWHHVTTDAASLARLGRHVCGEATALVLGGGGARGLAHLGVIRAMEETGRPIDAVGGTSIGAIMGAFAALSWDEERRMAVARSGFVDTRRLVGYTLPLVSLSSSKKLTRLLRHHVGDTAIEDLPVPFFCVSADYATGEPVIHDRGPLWWALRASISLPGVLPPVFAGGQLLVDGGVVNNLPVDIMQRRHAGPVIAVDLRSHPGARTIERFDPTTSGWEVLWRRLHPGKPSLRLPGPAATMLRAKELGGKDAHRRRRAAADVLLEPPVGSVDSMDFRSALPLADTAYQYALGVLTAASA